MNYEPNVTHWPKDALVFLASQLGKMPAISYNWGNEIGSPGGAGYTARRNTQEVLAPMCSPDYTLTPKKKSLPRSERRARRLARGLSPYAPGDVKHEQDRAKRRAKEKYDRKRAFIDSVKLERGCTDCGYRAHPAALQFDHLPGQEKKHTIAQMANNISMDRLIAEMAKCEVVCANCHAIRGAVRREERRQVESQGGGE